MHELAVTQSILDIADQHASAAGAKKVTDIYLNIGKLSSIVDDSVQFYWDMISAGTLCAGAALHFNRIPALIRCLDCQNEYTFEDEMIPCPVCGSSRIKVLSGNEFNVDSIEIDK